MADDLPLPHNTIINVAVIEFLTDKRIYDVVVCKRIPEAKKFLWIATSDIKDLHVSSGGAFVPFLEVLSSLVAKNIEVRLIHAKEPGPRFREDFDRYQNLTTGMERILCPRVHFKTVIVDGTFVYTGSANLTGSGIGAKSPDRRNFENGIISDEGWLIKAAMEQFDGVWRGMHCAACRRKKYCTDFRELLGRE